MRGKRAATLWLTTTLAVAAGPALADDAISKLETKDLRLLYYDPDQTYLTPYVARAYENSFRFQLKTFDWTPWEKPTVQLHDWTDNGGAGVRGAPTSVMQVDIAPVSTTFETWSPGERFFTLMNHELVHIATMDVWNEQDAWWRNFFHGKPSPVTAHPETILYSYLAQPRTSVPRWYLEGSAVFMETWMGGGLGRAQGGYDEMVFRAMVRDNAHFYDPLGLESVGMSVDFQVAANAYLYGTRFDSYLALTYGPEKVIAWLKRGNDSEGYYENQFEHVFGKSLDDAWADWIAFEHAFQAKNLESVQKFPVTPVERLTPQALGSVSRSYYDPKTNSLVAGFRDAGVLANIGLISLKNGDVRALTRLKGPALYRVTSLAYDPADGKAFFTADNNAYRDLMEVDVATGATSTLLEDARIGDIAFDPADKSIWGVRRQNGIDTLVRVRAAHDAWSQVVTFTYGHALSDLDISPDGQLLAASTAEINGDQRLEVYRISDLLNGAVNPVAFMALGQSGPEGGAFSPDGRYLFATAYYTGVSNVYRLEIATNKVEAVSNAVTGFFRPVPMPDGSLIVYEYTGEGFQPVRIDPKPLNDLGNVKFLGTELADKYPIVKSWAVGSPSRIDIEPMITEQGPYDPAGEMRYDGSYPIVEGYKGHIAAGWHFQMEDPLLYNQLLANLAYSPANNIHPREQLHADITYSTLYWKLTYWHNSANFYDLFGPTDNSRKGDAAIAAYHNVLIFDPPRQLDLNAELGWYNGLDTLPGAQNVQSGDSNIVSMKLALDYTNIDKSLGAVDYEAGYRMNFTLKNDYAHQLSFPKIRGGLDFGFALPWKHSSLWLYNATGVSLGKPSNVLDYFYFGAFGNNFVDDGEIKRYRNYDSFPGFDIDAIKGRSFVKSVGEWNLPPIRFEDVGVPAIYLSSIRSAFFGGIMVADAGPTTSATLENIGFQVDWNFTIAVRLPMTLSAGYAKGFGHAPGRHDEIMVSLKIL